MAEFLVLEDAQTNATPLPAGQIVDDGVFDVAELERAGVPLLAYNPATMEAPLTAFLGLAEPRTPGMLLALLVAAGAIGGGGGGGGDVTGPAASTDNAIARFNGLTGKLLQNSLVTITDLGSIALPGGQTVDGRDVSADGTLLDATAGSLTAHIGAGGAAHAAATTSVAGFMSAADKTAHDAVVADAIRDADFAGSFPADLARTGAGAYAGIRSNLAATVAPTVNDDASGGYAVGSRWVNVSMGRAWQCVDATGGAAVWIELGGGGGGGPSMQVIEGFSSADFFSHPSAAPGDAGGFSVVWYGQIRGYAASAGQFLISKSDTTDGWGIQIGGRALDGFYLIAFMGATAISHVFNARPGVVHLALVFDGTTLEFYIDGIRAEFTGTPTFAASPESLIVGRVNPWIEPFTQGGWAGAAYIEAALTSQELQEHLQACRDANRSMVAGAIAWDHLWSVSAPGGGFPATIEDLAGAADLTRSGTGITGTVTRQVL